MAPCKQSLCRGDCANHTLGKFPHFTLAVPLMRVVDARAKLLSLEVGDSRRAPRACAFAASP